MLLTTVTTRLVANIEPIRGTFCHDRLTKFNLQLTDPVVNAACFHPGFVKNSFISEGLAIPAGGKIS